MSYDLHITRAEKTWESKNNPIPLEEWNEIVDNDPEMRQVDKLEVKNPQTATTITIPMTNGAVWNHPKLKSEVPFRYVKGRISVSNPDEIIIKKMKEISEKLCARVLGDEEEQY